MKKTLLTLGLIGVAASSFAQGTINFVNNNTALITTNVNGNSGSAAISTTSGIRVGLYGGDNGAGSSTLQLLGFTTISPVAGRFNANALTNTFISAAGGLGTFQVRAWSGGFASYEAAFAAAQGDTSILIGASGVWSQDTGNNTAVPAEAATPMVLGAGGFTGVVMTTVTPEPGTIALGVLGVGSLLALRRRKS